MLFYNSMEFTPNMLKKYLSIFALILVLDSAKAQLLEPYVHQGEVGISAGFAHYFGDLNPNSAINRPKSAVGIFFRKQITNYIGVRLSGDYASLGYSDVYSNNPVQNTRNLSFNTNVWELALAADFNFFEFHPGFEGYTFTPYIGLGLGVFPTIPMRTWAEKSIF